MNIVSSAKSANVALGVVGILFVYTRYRNGERQDPWATPVMARRVVARELPNLTWKNLSLRNDRIIFSS